MSPSGLPFSTMSASVSTSVKPTPSQSRVIMQASAQYGAPDLRLTAIAETVASAAVIRK